MIVAIDGPAASGKGTLARRIAKHFGLTYLDTGSLYRTVACAMLADGLDPHDAEAAHHTAETLDLKRFEDAQLRTIAVGEAASVVAAMPKVRQALLELQRTVASTPPGAVLDGRDIGTVVCPDADVKLFVTASPEERARRRHLELQAGGDVQTYDLVLEQLRIRDRRDAERSEAPLKPAEDAVLLDTSELDIEAAFQAAVEIVSGKR